MAQDIVLKPNENITSLYTLEEWIYSNANWSYDSYDLTNFEPFSPLYASSLEKAPVLFIDNQVYLTGWLNNDLFDFPNISFSAVDSIIVQPHKKITNGFFTPNGNIQIFLKKNPTSVIVEKGFVNQINDPGPNLATDLRTLNVEYISRVNKAALSLPKIANTNFIYSRSNFSRTNVFIYDREVNRTLFRRTTNLSDPRKLQRNDEYDFILSNKFSTSLYALDMLTSISYKSQFHQWHALSGIEVPATHRKGQFSANFNLVKKSFYRGSVVNFSYASSDSLPQNSRDKYNLNESLLNHTSTFQFPLSQNQLTVYINNSLFYWGDFYTKRSKLLNSNSLTFNYKSLELGSLSIVLGNYNVGFNYQKKLLISQNLSLSTFKTDLRANGYNYTLWTKGIGFSSIDPTKHTVINKSNFSNLYSTASLNTEYRSRLYELEVMIFQKHYWTFVNTTTDYGYNEKFEELSSTISYSDLQNVGFVGYSASFNLSVLKKTSLKSSLSGRFFNYGDASFSKNLDGINSIIFSQSIRYQPNYNAILEIQFKYIAPREIAEFEGLEQSPVLSTRNIRAIKRLNASLKTWFFDRSLALTLSLRNLLNSTESYNTNGQYYNMSINVSASVHVGKK